MPSSQLVASRRSLELLGEGDLPWIDDLVRRLEGLVGQPWREVGAVLAEMPSPARPRHRNAVIDALRYLLVPERSALRGMHVRRELLGAPVFDPASRDARIEEVAARLRSSPAHVMRILWTDLAKQRVVELPRIQSPREIAAEANVRLIQRVVGRCFELRLLIRGDATPLVRAAVARGLLVSTSRGAPRPIVRRNGVEVAGSTVVGETTELTISGPLTVFHHTVVYGRTLCALVRELAAARSFVLDARCDLGYGPTVFHVETPVILPPPPSARPTSAVERRFERDLAKRASGWSVERTPTAYVLRRGSEVVTVEIIGYWTAAYLVEKLATHAGPLILCIDAERALTTDELPAEARIVRFEKRVPIDRVLAILEQEA